MRLTGTPCPTAAVIGFTLTVFLAAPPRLQGQAAPQESLVWAPVPTKPNPWIAPNKPHTKLADVLASHKGQASWREPIVRDALLTADYVQMAPGTKTPRQFQPDSPIWWIVQERRSAVHDRRTGAIRRHQRLSGPGPVSQRLPARGRGQRARALLRGEGHRFADDVPGRRDAGARNRAWSS